MYRDGKVNNKKVSDEGWHCKYLYLIPWFHSGQRTIEVNPSNPIKVVLLFLYHMHPPDNKPFVILNYIVLIDLCNNHCKLDDPYYTALIG